MHILFFNGALPHQWECLRLDLVLDHVSDELIGHLLEHLLGQLSQIHRVKVFEFDELHYIAHCRLISRIPHDLVIPVKFDHIREIRLSNPHNDDTEGVLRALDYQIFGLLHIVDDTVGENEQDVIHRLLDVGFHIV